MPTSQPRLSSPGSAVADALDPPLQPAHPSVLHWGRGRSVWRSPETPQEPAGPSRRWLEAEGGAGKARGSSRRSWGAWGEGEAEGWRTCSVSHSPGRAQELLKPGGGPCKRAWKSGSDVRCCVPRNPSNALFWALISTPKGV